MTSSTSDFDARNDASNNRLTLLDTAKGLAIVLVVAGHLVARDIKPAGNEWYEVANSYLYRFHMAFFFFLSGLVFFYKGRLPKSMREYGHGLRRRFLRVAPAYCIMACIVFFGKLLSQSVLSVDRKVEASSWEFLKLLLYPTDSYASFLWFIFVLLLIEAIVPLLYWFSRSKAEVLFFVALIIFFVPMPKILALHQVSRYLVFFVFAIFFADKIPWLFSASKKFVLVWLALFLVAIIFVPFSMLHLLLGAIALFLLLGATAWFPPRLASRLELLGRYTFVIYLLNTVVIGLIKAVGFKIVSWDGLIFFAYLPILLGAGLLVPVLLKKYIFCRIPWLDRITS